MDILTKELALIIFNIGLLLIIGKVLDKISMVIKAPAMTLQMIAGVILGPYMLGNFSLPFFKKGLFPNSGNSLMPVSQELFIIGIFASLIILFYYGLLGNTSVFKKYTDPALLISIAGIFTVFFLNLFLVSKFTKSPLYEINNIIFALSLSSTSLGITSYYVLNKKSKLSNDKLVALTSSITEKMLLILFFAVIFYMVSSGKLKNDFVRNTSSFNIMKVIVVWLLFLIITLGFAKSLSKFKGLFGALSFIYLFIAGFFLFICGLFDKAGIPLIVSAYLFGLIISKTDYSYIILGFIRNIYNIFVPLFFIICGMFIKPSFIFTKESISIILLCSLLTILSKTFLASIISYFFNYTLKQSKNIGIGLSTTGETGLIFSLTGINYGFINIDFFSLTVSVIIVASIFNSIIYNIFKNKSSVDDFSSETITLESDEFANLVSFRLLDNFKEHGFTINTIELLNRVHFLKKGELFFAFRSSKNLIKIESEKRDIALVKNFFYDILIDFTKKINEISGIGNSKNQILQNEPVSRVEKKTQVSIKEILNENNIILNLKAAGKKETLEELLTLLYNNGQVRDKNEVLEKLIEREKIVSTGMQQGIAIPHCKSKSIDKISMAIGLNREGLPFDSIDGKPSKIFIMILTPESEINAHLHILMLVSSLLKDEDKREKLLNLTTAKEVLEFFTKSKIKT